MTTKQTSLNLLKYYLPAALTLLKLFSQALSIDNWLMKL